MTDWQPAVQDPEPSEATQRRKLQNRVAQKRYRERARRRASISTVNSVIQTTIDNSELVVQPSFRSGQPAEALMSTCAAEHSYDLHNSSRPAAVGSVNQIRMPEDNLERWDTRYAPFPLLDPSFEVTGQLFQQNMEKLDGLCFEPAIGRTLMSTEGSNVLPFGSGGLYVPDDIDHDHGTLAQSSFDSVMSPRRSGGGEVSTQVECPSRQLRPISSRTRTASYDQQALEEQKWQHIRSPEDSSVSTISSQAPATPPSEARKEVDPSFRAKASSMTSDLLKLMEFGIDLNLVSEDADLLGHLKAVKNWFDDVE